MEKDLTEVKDKFQEFKTIVRKQGKQVDQIEKNFIQAEKNVKDGESEIKKADEYQKKIDALPWYVPECIYNNSFYQI